MNDDTTDAPPLADRVRVSMRGIEALHEGRLPDLPILVMCEAGDVEVGVMAPGSGRGDMDAAEVVHVLTHALEAVAKRHDLPVFVAAGLNRGQG